VNNSTGKPQDKISVVAVGESHLVALMRACTDIRQNLAARITFIRVDQQKYRPVLNNRGELNLPIRKTIAEAKPKFILCSIGGNTHNVVGLLNHPRAFDFVLPEQPDLPLNENAEIVPSGIIHDVFKERLNKNPFMVMRAIAKSSDVPILHLETPPPLPTEYILRCPGAFFGARIQQLGVAPALLRYKLWRLHSAIVKEFCAESGVTFVSVPEQTLDPHGMLVETAWGDDPTHGNAWFGAQVLKKSLGAAAYP
jgi:hypothetical protein